MKRLLTAAVVAAALWAAACSSGGSGVQPPPPAGKYSAASLNGQYAFMTSGEVLTGFGFNAPTPLTRVGTFTADGKGNITGGVEDVNAAGQVTNAVLINSAGSSYTVNADGRGTLILSVGQNTLEFGIVMTSTSDGLMIDETSTSSQASTGSGNFILQNSADFNISAINGPYVFDFPGLDASSSPESFMGEFSASGGTISTGIFDDNDFGTFSSGSITGTLAQDNANSQAPMSTFGRGIAQIAGQGFVFYIVDGSRVRFVSTTGGMLSGDAVAQTTPPTSLSGGFAFIVAGASGSGGVTRVGRFTANGASVTNVVMDTNNAGSFTLTGGSGGGSVSNASITMDTANPGRGTVTFKDSSLSVPFTFVFYLSSPTSGVIQDQSQSATKGATDIADGSILAQTGSPFSSSNISGTYALNWSGLSVQQGSFAIQDEEDLLAQANIKNLALSGTADIFQFTNGVPRTDFGLGGTITLGGDGTGGGNPGMRNSMAIDLNGASPINFVVYVASPQFAFFANSNNSGTQRIVAGVLKAQQ